MDGDPHIHVDVKVLHAAAQTRTMLASTFGLVADLPTVVQTGCGRQVAYAMTSPQPQSVTCLPCREHAHHEHLRFAEQVERLSAMPGSPVSSADGRAAAAWHREQAARFSE